MPSPFPCSPVVRECSGKKTQIEKKSFVHKLWSLISPKVTFPKTTESELFEP